MSRMNIETIQTLQSSIRKRIDRINENYLHISSEGLVAVSHGVNALIALDRHVEWTMKKDLDEKLCDEDPKDEVIYCARLLREAQKAYMADRGNEELGKRVGVSAEALDEALDNL